MEQTGTSKALWLIWCAASRQGHKSCRAQMVPAHITQPGCGDVVFPLMKQDSQSLIQNYQPVWAAKRQCILTSQLKIEESRTSCLQSRDNGTSQHVPTTPPAQTACTKFLGTMVPHTPVLQHLYYRTSYYLRFLIPPLVKVILKHPIILV